MSTIKRRNARSDIKWFIGLTSPALILFGVFTLWPVFYTFYISFTDWNMIRFTKNFVGLKNYIDLFSSSVFYQVVWNTFIFTFFTVFIRLVIALALALLLYQKIRFRPFFRTIVFLPHVTTTAVAAIVWMYIFHPRTGIARYAFTIFGAEAPNWIADPAWAMPAIIIVSIWKGIGFATVVYLAALSSVNPELQEAARIDGANEWRVFWNVTFVALTPVTLFLIITGILHTMQNFEIPAIMTQGGPFNATNIYVYHLYELGFMRFRAGYASAFATFFFAVMMVITFINLKLSKSWVHY